MNIKLIVTSTTDGKHIGSVITYNGDSIAVGGFIFEKNQILDLGDGLYRLFNTNYSIDCNTLTETNHA
jgi:hypothetical protein